MCSPVSTTPTYPPLPLFLSISPPRCCLSVLHYSPISQYYLDYKNVRPDYVSAIWGLANWSDVEARLAAAKK